MEQGALYLVAADSFLLIHALFVGFVIFGLLVVLVGKLCAWGWVRNPWFRYAHLAAIGFVVLQSWVGGACPLTVWESALRAKAGGAVYSGTFVGHWLESILFYRAPDWIFVVSYTVFGAVVVAAWFWVPPRRFLKGGA
jgi:hypothetical protein